MILLTLFVLLLYLIYLLFGIIAQKLKFYPKDFFSKCDQIRMKWRIWLHLLNKSLMKNFIFCVVNNVVFNPFPIKFSFLFFLETL